MLSRIQNSTFILHHQYPSPHFNLSSIFPTISLLKFRENGVMSKKIATLKYIVNKEGVNGRENSMCCRCMRIESEMNLEEMILEFTKKSDKPDKFPTKKELISAGRFDLAEAISLRGGWFSLGWEVEDEIEEVKLDAEEFRRKVGNCEWSDLARKNEANLGEYASSFAEDWVDPGKSGTKEEISYDSGSHHNHYTKPKLWRTSRIQRAGFHYTEFEAAEILYHHEQSERRGRDDEIVSIVNDEGSENCRQVLCQDQICTLLQRLESEMSSSLHSLRSFRKGFYPKEAITSSSSELKKLSDVSEFQENEVMSAQERLQYIREMKIFFPSSASEILLVGSFDDWATQVSETLNLSRRMERSSSGIFSASLELYPGRYEIKFIVDGIWRVDPLRPIVRNNGIKNNLLIIT